MYLQKDMRQYGMKEGNLVKELNKLFSMHMSPPDNMMAAEAAQVLLLLPLPAGKYFEKCTQRFPLNHACTGTGISESMHSLSPCAS